MSVVALCGLRGEAQLLPSSLTVLCGPAARDALAHLVPSSCAALLSWGCCGGLSPKLGVGDLVVIRRAQTGAGFASADPALASRLAAVVGAPLVDGYSSTETFSTPGDKANLLALTGAWVCDQETWAVAAVAADRKVPWAAVRAVSDPHDGYVSPASAGATNPDGSPDVGRVLSNLFWAPLSLSTLISNATGYGQALASLGHAAAAVAGVLA